MLVNELYEKKLDRLFQLSYKEAMEHLENLDSHYDIFYEKYWFIWQYVTFHLSRGEQDKIVDKIYERAENSIFLFLCDLLLSLRDMKVNERSYNFTREPDLAKKLIELLDTDSLFEYIDKHDFKNKHIVQSYYLSYLMHEHFDDEKYFYRLKKFVDENIGKFKMMGKITIVVYLINYCLDKIAGGKDEFEKSLYDVYKLFIAHKLYLGHPYFPLNIFLNIIDNYISLDKLDELKQFLKTHTGHLNPSQIKNVSSLCGAMIEFREARYEDALKTLAAIKSDSKIVRPRLRPLLLKVLFECEDYDSAKEALNNYRSFAVSNKFISGTRRNIALQFIEDYNVLLKLKLDPEDFDLIHEFKKKLHGSKNYPGKAWFFEKLNEFESKHCLPLSFPRRRESILKK